MKLGLGLATLIIAGSAIAAPKNSSPKPWAQEPDSFMGISFDQKLVYSLPQCPAGYDLPTAPCRGEPYQGLYTIKGTPAIGLGYSLSAMAKTGPVDYFYLTTHSDDFLRLEQLFISKYGQPSKRSTEVVKTKVGAEFTNERLHWIGKKVEILLQKYDGDIDTSSASLNSRAATQRSVIEGGQKIQDAASKL